MFNFFENFVVVKIESDHNFSLATMYNLVIMIERILSACSGMCFYGLES